MSWVISLRTCHTLHMIMRTTSLAVSSRGSNKVNSHSGPVSRMVSTLGMFQSIAMSLHSSLSSGHLQSAWNPSSHSTPHRGQTSVSSRCREALLAQVASEFVTTLHANTRTLGGAGDPHMIFQMARRPSGAMLVAVANGRSRSSIARRYVDRTVKIPFFSGAQAMTASVTRGDVLMVVMTATYVGRKYR